MRCRRVTVRGGVDGWGGRAEGEGYVRGMCPSQGGKAGGGGRGTHVSRARSCSFRLLPYVAYVAATAAATAAAVASARVCAFTPTHAFTRTTHTPNPLTTTHHSHYLPIAVLLRRMLQPARVCLHSHARHRTASTTTSVRHAPPTSPRPPPPPSLPRSLPPSQEPFNNPTRAQPPHKGLSKSLHRRTRMLLLLHAAFPPPQGVWVCRRITVWGWGGGVCGW